MRLKAMAGRVLEAALQAAVRLVAPITDRGYELPDVPAANLTAHTSFFERVVEAAGPGARVLEIGSREVQAPQARRDRLAHAEYVGFDVYPGPNVDVVGDAHRLSELVEGPFDVVYSSAVFEHLAMPWVVAEEIAKVTRVGGMVFIETHFSFVAHERPWHFFQFSDMGLKALFSPALGFECIEASLQNPIVGRFSHYADAYLRYLPLRGLYCHASYIGRKVRDVPDFRWRDADVEAVVGATRYPPPS